MKTYRIFVFCIIQLGLVCVLIGCSNSSGQINTSETNVAVSASESGLQPVADQPVQPSQAIPSGDGPVISLQKAAHDFGQIGPSTSNKAMFEFSNVGNEVLVVQRIISTCGCSKPTLIKDGKRYPMPLKEPVVFESSQAGQVEVTYKSPNTTRLENKSLYIVSNDPKTPRAELKIKADVASKVTASPGKFDLRFDQENAGMGVIVVESKDNKPFSIKSVVEGQKAVSVDFDPKQKASQFKLTPKVDLKKLETVTDGTLQITTDHPQSGLLLVRYEVLPKYTIQKPRYILQNIEPGKTIIKENLITSHYGVPVKIASTSSRNGYMEVENEESKDNQAKLSVKITVPDDPKLKKYITDELQITLEDGNSLSIRCSGWYRKS